eukprot:TRINITY_DN51210_c0_g1_i1.p2 TRINITY_DN51210_c0_g1~~TRINITY_DN51210_c0_g1_i1.p2  ORF type:complete len:151 (-),score=23.78 TRINITY_DN51210_c0_g1_i1:104-556(-)
MSEDEVTADFHSDDGGQDEHKEMMGIESRNSSPLTVPLAEPKAEEFDDQELHQLGAMLCADAMREDAVSIPRPTPERTPHPNGRAPSGDHKMTMAEAQGSGQWNQILSQSAPIRANHGRKNSSKGGHRRTSTFSKTVSYTHLTLPTKRIV